MGYRRRWLQYKQSVPGVGGLVLGLSILAYCAEKYLRSEVWSLITLWKNVDFRVDPNSYYWFRTSSRIDEGLLMSEFSEDIFLPRSDPSCSTGTNPCDY